jgi:hypothetical protein
MSKYIKTKEGVPELRDFAAQDGTPLVIDVLTGIAYYLHKNLIFPIQGGVSVTGAFSDGFDTGFS